MDAGDNDVGRGPPADFGEQRIESFRRAGRVGEDQVGLFGRDELADPAHVEFPRCARSRVALVDDGGRVGKPLANRPHQAVAVALRVGPTGTDGPNHERLAGDSRPAFPLGHR